MPWWAWFFGQEAARGEIVAQIQGVIGQEGAIAVQGLLKSTNAPNQDIVALVVSSITLIIGATTIFGELQGDLDRIWRVPAPAAENGLWALLRKRLLSFGMVLGLGFLLLAADRQRGHRRIRQMGEWVFRKLGSDSACARF